MRAKRDLRKLRRSHFIGLSRKRVKNRVFFPSKEERRRKKKKKIARTARALFLVREDFEKNSFNINKINKNKDIFVLNPRLYSHRIFELNLLISLRALRIFAPVYFLIKSYDADSRCPAGVPSQREFITASVALRRFPFRTVSRERRRRTDKNVYPRGKFHRRNRRDPAATGPPASNVSL